jgi:hypothetical protein
MCRLSPWKQLKVSRPLSLCLLGSYWECAVFSETTGGVTLTTEDVSTVPLETAEGKPTLSPLETTGSVPSVFSETTGGVTLTTEDVSPVSTVTDKTGGKCDHMVKHWHLSPETTGDVPSGGVTPTSLLSETVPLETAKGKPTPVALVMCALSLLRDHWRCDPDQWRCVSCPYCALCPY